ncbi:response regulator transcription factor [Herbidospora mongoliensis]|uniref:response regulator transcription factor n=1 Tax=Herbidospora mongoliensis TaxID=688067 RepID=UPI000B08A279|nr:response regulator transcription factor [Herbidospora mongoliensis]
MRILVVDDHEVVRNGVVASLSAMTQFRVVGVAGTGEDAIALGRRTHPDAAIVDLRLPDMTGQTVCRRLIEDSPEIAVVMLTTYLSDDTVRSAQAAGAAAYVTKAAGIARLKETLLQVAADRRIRLADQSASSIVHRLDGVMNRRTEHQVVTPHQRRVLELVAAGLTNGQIGDRLCISESTVRFHIQKLKRTLAVSSRTALVVKAMQDGTIPPAPEDGEIAAQAG